MCFCDFCQMLHNWQIQRSMPSSKSCILFTVKTTYWCQSSCEACHGTALGQLVPCSSSSCWLHQRTSAGALLLGLQTLAYVSVWSVLWVGAGTQYHHMDQNPKVQHYWSESNSLRLISTLSSHLHLGFLSSLFPFVFSAKMYAFLVSPSVLHIPHLHYVKQHLLQN